MSQKNITYSYTAQCPFLNRSHTISITSAEVPMCGVPTAQYKKIGYDCNYYNECPSTFKDEKHRCQVYLDAPDH
jgi:hypothetical protein